MNLVGLSTRLVLLAGGPLVAKSQNLSARFTCGGLWPRIFHSHRKDAANPQMHASGRRYYEFIKNMLRAASLDRQLYREVAADRHATGQAFLVVLAVSLATNISALDEGATEAAKNIPAGIVLAAIGWVVGTSLAYVVGTKLLRSGTSTTGSNATWLEVARALGFAQAPGLVRVFGAVPGLGPTLLLTTLVWQLIAMVVALRQVFGYQSYWRAIGVLAAGFIPYVMIVWGVSTLLESS